MITFDITQLEKKQIIAFKTKLNQLHTVINDIRKAWDHHHSLCIVSTLIQNIVFDVECGPEISTDTEKIQKLLDAVVSVCAYQDDYLFKFILEEINIMIASQLWDLHDETQVVNIKPEHLV